MTQRVSYHVSPNTLARVAACEQAMTQRTAIYKTHTNHRFGKDFRTTKEKNILDSQWVRTEKTKR